MLKVTLFLLCRALSLLQHRSFKQTQMDSLSLFNVTFPRKVMGFLFSLLLTASSLLKLMGLICWQILQFQGNYSFLRVEVVKRYNNS